MKTETLRRPLRSVRRAVAPAAAALFVWAHAAHAALETGLDTTASTAGYEKNPRDVSDIVSGLIKSVLSVMGVVFLILTIYAGFLWMTAQGNEEQVTKARKMLVSSVIGMIIIFSAYAITNFLFTDVLSNL